ncbi:RNA cap guanine-N2 methyltransferase [Hirsutella rhossiliensis]|uniref:Trimethylguanosine synthase n=1 Tax=Hirsutella rhossiliensis TaxID=111463 RepID=A0A9P8MW76_9HYPO|nr:RNA cap guanine-N2 methyltransferase domain-containing protein [Hirsutella rhossiliensis]KAH0963223.1 RNA cap guanine-N2 methyltransferase domain-containing protein [Hirsutella rhossiliensis]
MRGSGLGNEGVSREDPAAGFSMEPALRLPLTAECKHYTGKHEVPWDNQKYFAQRFSIFSLYDQGVHLTDDAWFGVTPEPVAREVARDLGGTNEKKKILIDAFAGAGGNTIAFALSERWEHIVAVERDASTLACAQHNAEVYGVDPSLVTWVLGDSFEYVDALVHRRDQLHPDLRVNVKTSVLFASPPWGGPGYTCDKIFDLSTMQPYNLEQLHGAYQAMDHGLFLPRTSDIRQIAKLAPSDRKISVVQYCMQGASKAMVAYIPAKTADSPDESPTLVGNYSSGQVRESSRPGHD